MNTKTVTTKLDIANGRRRARTLEVRHIQSLVKKARANRRTPCSVGGGEVCNAYGHTAYQTHATAYATRAGVTYIAIDQAYANRGSRGTAPSQSSHWKPETNRRKLAEWLRTNRSDFIRVAKGARI